MTTTPDTGPSDERIAPDLPERTWAWTHDRFGGAEVLGRVEVDVPELDADQVMIRTSATSMNAADRYQVRCPALAMRPIFGFRRPRRTIPGLDVTGTVAAVGDEVTHLAVGDRVLTETSGAWSGFTQAPADEVVAAPDAIPLADAAALPVGGLTALQGLRDVGGVTPGSSVLVYGATGAVGSLAVQIAVALGAEVTAVCASDAAELVRSLGARRIVDRSVVDGGTPAQRLAADRTRFDVIFDVAGVETIRDRARLLAPDGTCVVVGAPSGGRILGPIRSLLGTMIGSRLVPGRFRSFVARLEADDHRTLVTGVEVGRRRPVIDERFGFDELPRAFERFETVSKLGSILVEDRAPDG
ncbi:MAG: NAD(P)-dependent alcohol dehydrogenase [Actinomycetota bacterium]